MKTELKIDELQYEILKFARDRDWEKFHTLKNLSIALSVETSELLEIFQWLNDDEVKEIQEKKRDHKKFESIRDEVADVLVYTLRIAQVLDLDIKETIEKKMRKNAAKYPVSKSYGNSTKYDELD